MQTQGHGNPIISKGGVGWGARQAMDVEDEHVGAHAPVPQLL